MTPRPLAYAALAWAGVLLAAAAPRAAELAFGQAYAHNGFIAVPLLLVPGSGESVASLQVDIVTAPGYAVHDIAPAPAATGAGKDVVYAGGPGRTTVIVAGFNQQRMDAGAITTVYLSPERDAAAPPELALAHGVISDPRGNALPVELRAGTKAVDDTRDPAATPGETAGGDVSAPTARPRDAGSALDARDAGSPGWTAYAGPDDAGFSDMDRHTGGASRAGGGLLRMPDASGSPRGAPGRESSLGRAGQSGDDGSRPEGWMMRPQPPLLIRRLEFPADTDGDAPARDGARAGVSADPSVPGRVAAFGARDGLGARASGAQEARGGGARTIRWGLPSARGWMVAPILAGCLAGALLARRRLFRKG